MTPLLTTSPIRSALRSPAPSGPLKLCYFGAPPDTGNMGVSALCYSVLTSLTRSQPGVQLTVFDHGRGVRPATFQLDGVDHSFERVGAAMTRRYYRRESMANVRLSAWLGGLGNPAARRLLDCDAVLDISGGDSFTDLYGPRRFASVVACKHLALELGKPLILLPQTYGPFRSARCREIARRIVRRAAVCWARDPRSFEILKDLLGSDFDPQRHCSGVDVAFALEPVPPAVPLPEPIATWLSAAPSTPASAHSPFSPSHLRTLAPLVGFNVSGLIYQDPAAMRQRYGFKADYREIVHSFLRRLLAETNVNVLLVPHVLTPPGHYESDFAASERVLEFLRADSLVGSAARQRVAVVPAVYDQSELKWIISRLDWFCGTRMHACIAGLSSGVPTAAIAYSDKTRGVFETCGQGDAVVDPRELDTSAATTNLTALWSKRVSVAAPLNSSISALSERAGAPFVRLLSPDAAIGANS